MTWAGGSSDARQAILTAPALAEIVGHQISLPPLIRLRREDGGAPSGHALHLARQALAAAPDIPKGSTVAIGVGSRGIVGLADIVRACVDGVRQRGGDPFIFPAMGSHGGATAHGQQAVLAHLGITEAAVGAPVRAGMSVVELSSPSGTRAFVDALAASADYILVINRIKSHTSFSGRVESGLAKMLAVGMGKQVGAEELHRRGPAHLEARILGACEAIKASLAVWGGLAIVETAHKTLEGIHFLTAEQIGGDREAELLQVAKSHEARLPFAQLDVLIVDKMGKNLSGTGMDTNVLGRRMVRGMPELTNLDITNIVVLRVTEESHGNATGIGLADFVSARTLQDVDLSATYANAITAGLQGVQRAQIPIALATDLNAVQAAVFTAGVEDATQIRLARIKSTLHLDDIMVTANLLPEIGDGFVAAAPAVATALQFTDEGDVAPWPETDG